MKPLAGLRVVVTRAVHQIDELAGPLRELGAEVIALPVISIAPPANPKILEAAAARCNEYDWIIFTSANAVEFFSAALPPGSQCRTRVATVGAATHEAAERHGFHVTLTPEKYVAESLAEAFAAQPLNGARVLIPSAAVSRDVLPGELRKRGATVEVVEAYRNVLPDEAAERARLIFQHPYPDWVLFASSSAVDNLVRLAGTEALRNLKIATIGPITSKTVLKYGLEVSAEAGTHTAGGLVDSVIRSTTMTTDALDA